MRRLVADTGPILHLHEAALLDLLPLLGEVYIPNEVARELDLLAMNWQAPDWLQVEYLSEPAKHEAQSWQSAGLLDVGEAAALALTRNIGADWFLTDDAAARLLARTRGLEVHGSLGVVLGTTATGHLNRQAAAMALDALARSSLWLSLRILNDARTALDRLFSGDRD